MPPIVLYDSNLLYPFHLRNWSVQLGVNHIVRPRWTDAMHVEWIQNLAANGRVTRDRLLRTRDITKRALPDAGVRNYEDRIPSLTLPDPDDRHVLTAAVEAGPDIILPFNLRHFPTELLLPFGVFARDPDSFLCELLAAGREAVLAVVEMARLSLSRTAPSREEFIAALERQRLGSFAARLRCAWSPPVSPPLRLRYTPTPSRLKEDHRACTRTSRY